MPQGLPQQKNYKSVKILAVCGAMWPWAFLLQAFTDEQEVTCRWLRPMLEGIAVLLLCMLD